MKEAARQDSSTPRIRTIPRLTFEQVKHTLMEKVALSCTFGFLTIGKSICFTKLFFHHSTCPREWTDSGWKGKRKKGRQTVFFTPLNPFGGDPDEEETRDD